MTKQTPFSLFVRQALQLFGGISFSPQPSDVKKDVVYAGGNEVGTFVGAPVSLEWTDLTFSGMDWDTAVLYAQYLDADGVTVDETPQNYWSLPTESQLLAALSDQFILALPSQTCFQDSIYYWSSCEGDSTLAWLANYISGNVGGYYGAKSSQDYSFRCVH